MARVDAQRRDPRHTTALARRRVVLVVLMLAAVLPGCSQRNGEYASVSTFSRNGFVKNTGQAQALVGKVVKAWGYVDYGNLTGDTGAKAVLGEWWSGEGPDASAWGFNVKAGPQVPVGRSFQVRVKNDDGRDDLLKEFATNASANRPTQVFVKGRVRTFDAPLNITERTGLYMEVESSSDISLRAPDAR